MSAREELRMHLAQASTRAENDAVREHLDAALRLLDEDVPALVVCRGCGLEGLPQQIAAHECSR
jgi:hypothetical protein